MNDQTIEATRPSDAEIAKIKDPHQLAAAIGARVTMPTVRLIDRPDGTYQTGSDVMATWLRFAPGLFGSKAAAL